VLIVTQGKRSAEDIAKEYVSAMKTIRVRQQRLIPGDAAAEYSARLDKLANELVAVCLQADAPDKLVMTVEELNAAEAALEAARAWLAETVHEFRRMDRKAESMIGPAEPQVVAVEPAVSEPAASDMTA